MNYFVLNSVVTRIKWIYLQQFHWHGLKAWKLVPLIYHKPWGMPVTARPPNDILCKAMKRYDQDLPEFVNLWQGSNMPSVVLAVNNSPNLDNFTQFLLRWSNNTTNYDGWSMMEVILHEHCKRRRSSTVIGKIAGWEILKRNEDNKFFMPNKFT